jgi:integrator complex subunit 1
MDPLGKPRRPPKAILEQLHLLNVSHRLGHLLCRSRKPDLLLDIIQRQGTSQSMPWLSDLVQSSDGDFNHLPVQCLCEFLLSNSGNISSENTRDIELIAFLQKMLHSVDENDFQCSYEVLEYFLRRLSSTSTRGRQSAIQACRLLLKNLDDSKDMEESDSDAESDWLLKYLPGIPSFPFICDKIIAQLRAACQVENLPDLIIMYIHFIMTNTFNDPVTDMLEHVACWSLLIVERSSVFASILPKSKTDPKYSIKFQTLEYLFIMFNNFIIKMKENNSELTLPEYPDLLVVHFADGTQCHMHLNFIHALIILLCECEEVNRAMELLEYFFPADNYNFPQAYSVETEEKVQILPDWLKLKMIRSTIERMVEVALHDLTPEQLVLFIQSFGTPKNSMSKLLALLDSAVVQNTEAINEAILNRSFLAKIIEIQQLRGAKNGHIALKYLKSLDNSEETQFMETKSNEKIEILEIFDPTKVKPRPTTMVRKFSSSYHVSSLLGDVLKKDEDEPMPIAAFNQPPKSFSGMKLCETGRNTHHIMSELIFSTHPFDIERFAHINLNLKNLKQSKLAALIDCMSVMLKDDRDKLSVNKSGIIIDWLVQFDSELIRTNLDVQVSLLFGKSIQIYRPYFLSLLIHQANWSTIALALDKLLNQNNSMGIYDPSSVLDFIDAIIRSPKLWQGRDKSYSNHEQIEFVLTLDDEKIKAFIDYILREEEMLIAKCESKMNERVSLLLTCVQASSLSLKVICKHLENFKCEKRVKDRFLQRLYMKIPHLFLSSKYKTFIADMEVMFESLSSTGDTFGHHIITTIASLRNNRDFQLFSQDVELILRKFAACHPALLLRELPLLASLVAGRSHMDLRLLRQEHHISFLLQMIGIFELLRPQIFNDTYKIPLHKALTCYLQLIQVHGKDLYVFTLRVLDFLKSYTNENIVSAYQLINQFSELLIDIYLKNRSIHSLQIILSSTYFVSKSMIFEPPPNTNKNDSQLSLTGRLSNMSKMTQEKLLSELQEIENITKQKPGPLEDILGDLTELIFNSSSDVRNLSHSMLLKLLKHNPGNSTINLTCFNSYQLCLKHDDVNISLSVLDNLTEIVLSLQEYASEILQCVFNLGITSKTNTFTQLKKCMNAIKIQNGC